MRLLTFKLAVPFLAFAASTQAHAAAQLRDVGVIGLMSHDIFSWDRVTSQNTENGRLDLSTIFDYEGGTAWEKGGNPKNCENAPVCTVAMTLVKHYQEQQKLVGDVEARKDTVLLFQGMVKDSYQRLSGLPLPTVALSELANNHEQAALRAMHDILPGKVQLYGRLFKTLELTNPFFAKLQLNDEEMNQELKAFDGDYDREYKEIKIPFSEVVINLMEVDRKFIETFSPYKQTDMLQELALVGKGEMAMTEVSFMHHISDLVAKGLCAKDNAWMPDELPCN